MNELDELKLQWRQTSLRVAKLEKDKQRLMAELRESKLQPSLRRLASSYRNMSIWSCLMLALTYPIFHILFADLFNNLPAAIWIAIFLVAIVGDSWLCHLVNRINVAIMTVDEVSKRALQCRRLHLTLQALLIPLLIVFIWVLYYQLPYGRLGVLIGSIIGCAFGICKWLQLMRDYRSLIVSLPQ